MKNNLGRVYVPGGVLSPGELRQIANASNYFGIESIHIGNRQDILLQIDKNYSNDLKKRLDGSQYHFEVQDTANLHVVTYTNHVNIVTSFAAKNIFPSTSWVTEGLYLELLSSFNYQPKLKINIVDPFQSLVPLFTGHLNFIASPYDNYWYLFLRLPKNKNCEMWPVLVDGNEMSALAETIEELVIKNRNISLINLQGYIYNARTWNFRVMDKPLNIRPARFPNYEGFHSMGDKYWLGIYQRDNSFSLKFIDNLCMLCAQTHIGSINLTPWNSFIIKNIDEKDIPLWEKLLGKHGVNTGHSQLELNWQIPELDKKANKIKQFIFKKFEKKGLRTDGLIFGVTNRSVELASSISISKKSSLKILGRNFFTTYSVKYKKDFDANSWEIISFADGLKRRNLPNILAYICNLYYENLNSNMVWDVSTTSQNYSALEEPTEKEITLVHQCQNCLTVYDPAYGDQILGIPAGTAFGELPLDYKCSLCESSLKNFVPVNMEELVVK